MTKIQENEKSIISVTAAGNEPQISECDGYVLITQTTNEEGEKELSISGGKNMSPVDLASMILTLADQNQDLKTLLKGDFLKMAGEHILEIADDMLGSLVDRVKEEAKEEQEVAETIQ